MHHVDGPEVLNPLDEGPGNTNGAAQTGLETIAMLGLVGDHLPKEFPPVVPDDETAAPRRRPPAPAPAPTTKP